MGLGNNAWRAYLSVDGIPPTITISRPTPAVGLAMAPRHNAKGVMVAKDLAELQAGKGDASVFVDERGQPVGASGPDHRSPRA